MYGVILGDIIGSPYEHESIKGYGLPLVCPKSRITDDTIIALSTLETMRSNPSPSKDDFSQGYRSWVSRYRNLGFSPSMLSWVDQENTNAFMEGNSAGIRAAVVALFTPLDVDCTKLINKAVRITHTEDACRWALYLSQAIRGIIARGDDACDDVYAELCEKDQTIAVFDFDKFQKADFDASMWWTGIAAINIGLKADNFKDLYAKVLHVGGDTDSIAAMAGAIGQARWGASDFTDEFKQVMRKQANLLVEGTDRELYLEQISPVLG